MKETQHVKGLLVAGLISPLTVWICLSLFAHPYVGGAIGLLLAGVVSTIFVPYYKK